jgi:indole-3-glycerol phosphate synthase
MAEPARGGWLARILAAKRAELDELRRAPLPEPPAARPLGLARGAHEPLRLITEIKRRSPSAGALSTALGVAERAARYAAAGASMLSVLTDREFFDGSFEHLRQVREATALPILCKDFVIDEVQLDAARAWGADAALLIVRCLEPALVLQLVSAARARGLEPFVEIVTQAEAELALDAGARLIGVNARDLDTLEMDAARAQRVLDALPREVVAVHLSGLRRPEDVAEVAATRADAALVGEALMRLDDPYPLLLEMVGAARPRNVKQASENGN